MINIAVCDDERLIASKIERMLEEIENTEFIPMEIDVFYSGESLEKSVLSGAGYDLIFMDIEMKGRNGIDTAENIRKIDENVMLIYVSSYGQYMQRLFHLDVFEFINKPIKPDVFRKVFLKANERICSETSYFSFHCKNEEQKVLCSDIMYFESQGRQVLIYLKNGITEKFYGKLDDVEERLKNGRTPFLRIHQSFLVNYHQISSRQKTKVKMKNGETLTISEERQRAFGVQYSRLLGGEISE